MTKFTYPTGAQLYALEQMARRERAKTQARLILAAARWLKDAAKTVFFRPHVTNETPTGKVAYHG